jgi:hypothetical protein
MAQVYTSRRKPIFGSGVSLVTAVYLISEFDVAIAFPVAKSILSCDKL